MISRSNPTRLLLGAAAAAALFLPASSAMAYVVVNSVHYGATPDDTYGMATSIENSNGHGKRFDQDTYRGGPTELGTDSHYFINIRSYNDGAGNLRAAAGVFQFNITDAKSLGGNLDGATLEFHTWGGTKYGGALSTGNQLTVLGLDDGSWDSWDPYVGGQNSYETMPGVDFADTTTAGKLFFDPTKTTKLGTITFDNKGTILSNTTDVNLDNFLNADTNGLVTFFLYSPLNDEYSPTAVYDSGQIYVMGPAVGDTNPDDAGSLQANWPALILPNEGAPVPEPASLALMGLGGLALLRRRRKA